MRTRRNLRLRGFDYTCARLYFVTACTRDRRCVLGEVCADTVRLSRVGLVVHEQIEELPARLDVEIASPLRLGNVVGSFKAGSSREAGQPLWQRGYYDHVIRDEDDLHRIREYIATNPIRWALDPENPARVA